MTRHFNVGEAKTKLSQLLAAVGRGEDVVIDHAGKPFARLVLVEQARDEQRARIAAKRRAFVGSWAGAFAGHDSDVGSSMTDDDVEERYERKFGPAA